MLVRLEIKNFLSFDNSVEFNMLPARLTRLENHKIPLNDKLSTLKVAAIYGANASGKSNFIKAAEGIIDSVKGGKVSSNFHDNYFKLKKENKEIPSEFLIEFYTEGQHFCYCLDIHDNKVNQEKLSLIENSKENILFERKLILSKEKSTGSYDISIPTTNDSDAQLVELIKDNLLLEDDLLLYTFNKYSAGRFETIVDAYNWFNNKCVQLSFDTKAKHLTTFIEKNIGFKEFVNEKICNYGTGIKSIEIESISLEDYLGKNEIKLLEKIKKDLEKVDNVPIQDYYPTFRESIVFSKEEGRYLAKYLVFKHFGSEDNNFSFSDESDGTKRLIELLPLFFIVQFGFTIFVDEIERSLHPKLIKDLITTFSNSKQNKGQLIFTTHETHLLDQSILRTDEIWLCEKSKHGTTHMEPLSNFEVHSTKNIQNGYLQGRYGAIPFLGN